MDKRFNNIDELLELYFSGESSLEQERHLGEYFRCNNISPNHKKYSPLFEYMASEIDFVKDDKRVGLVWYKRARFIRYLRVASVAAVVVLTIGFVTERVVRNYSDQDYILIVNGEKINNKELAVNIMQEKLKRVSYSINRASDDTMQKLGAVKKSSSVQKMERVMEKLGVTLE